MSAENEEEATGPSVESEEQDERIEARKLRIQKRQELQRRALMGDDPSRKGPAEEVLSKSRHQMEATRQVLTDLEWNGLGLISNNQAAGDFKENERRVEEEDRKRQRKERFEAEIKTANERFEEITRKWESALQKEIPQDLQEMLMQQKDGCENLIAEKNKIITDFQMDLKKKDDVYVKDLKKSSEDIEIMIERMNGLYKELLKNYDEEVIQVEKAFVAERTDLVEGNMKKWTGMMQQRRDKEETYLKSREEKQEEYEKQLQHLRVQDLEEYNMMKIKLETDVQVLQQQLQQMKATYQLNQEKLEYNFQVLRKREDENTITKSQQKRKITRLHDNLTKLKNNMKKQVKGFQDENQQLTEEYNRTRDLFNDLQKKSRHFLTSDAKQFEDVWLMNEEECRDMATQLMDTDHVISEYILGLQWQEPDTGFMETTGPLQANKFRVNAIPARDIAKEILSAPDETARDGTVTTTARDGTIGASTALEEDPSVLPDDKKDTSRSDKLRSSILQKFSPKMLKTILELICDESGFLVESKLLSLLDPLETDEKALMKVDAIFTALGVDTEDDVQLLANYFTAAAEEDEDLREVDVQPENPAQASAQSDTVEDNTTKESGQSEVELDPDSQDAKASHRSSRPDLIHPNKVICVLRQFVEDTKEPARDPKTGQFTLTALHDRDSSFDSLYWLKYPQLIPDPRERLWDGLVDGLDKYHDTLHKRCDLIKETDGLRQQNDELRMLLHQYINSKVNQELEIPPTKVLQLELNPPQ